MSPLRAHVENGRLVLDEPTTLPEGTVVNRGAEIVMRHQTCPRMNWLHRSRSECDVFVTMDGNIEHQQSPSALSFGIVIIGAASNRMADLLPVVSELLPAIDAVQPGEIRRVGTSPKGRGRSKQAR